MSVSDRVWTGGEYHGGAVSATPTSVGAADALVEPEAVVLWLAVHVEPTS